MSGLKPNTEYFFRVQGTATDGTLYVGEVQTFRTLRQVTGGPVNLASLAAGARVIGISSNFGDATNDGPCAPPSCRMAPTSASRWPLC